MDTELEAGLLLFVNSPDNIETGCTISLLETNSLYLRCKGNIIFVHVFSELRMANTYLPNTATYRWAKPYRLPYFSTYLPNTAIYRWAKPYRLPYFPNYRLIIIFLF